MEILKSISENKIIGRLTASATILSAMYIIYQNISTDSVNVEIMVLAGVILRSASTFLFMSEK